MKFWKVVREFYKIKYDLTQSDLDTLMFLYSETYFSTDEFDEFDKLFGWDLKRFKKLKAAGWIVVFRKRYAHKKVIYELSFKTKKMITEMYKVLNGESEISESAIYNPFATSKATYKQKKYLEYIKEMNNTIRQRRRQTRE